jgi:hypothetical protein
MTFKVTSEIEKINHNLDKTCQTLDKTVSAESGIAESLSKIASKLPVQPQHDSNGDVDKTVENQSTGEVIVSFKLSILAIVVSVRYSIFFSRCSTLLDIELVLTISCCNDCIFSSWYYNINVQNSIVDTIISRYKTV